MNYSVVIPSNRILSQILPLLGDIMAQSVLPEEIVIVVDKKISLTEKEEYQKECGKLISSGVSCRLINHHDDDFIPGK